MSETAADSDFAENATLPFSNNDDARYTAWRAQKLRNYPNDSSALVVPVVDMANLTTSEHREMNQLIVKTNMVIYDCHQTADEPELARAGLDPLAAKFGLIVNEAHRSAGEENIVAIEVSGTGSKRGYIPYSNRPLNWHTDGYYNAHDKTIGAFLLHCARDAMDGGISQMLDPEIAYIRLRDENPAFVDALCHSAAMTIPQNEETDGKIRPVSIGPVFKMDGGHLTMRYTARSRSIIWRDDATTGQAVDFLKHLLDNNEPLIMSIKLRPGQGMLNNNVLHNRSGFENDPDTAQTRLLFRIRFHQRIKLLKETS